MGSHSGRRGASCSPHRPCFGWQVLSSPHSILFVRERQSIACGLCVGSLSQLYQPRPIDGWVEPRRLRDGVRHDHRLCHGFYFRMYVRFREREREPCLVPAGVASVTVQVAVSLSLVCTPRRPLSAHWQRRRRPWPPSLCVRHAVSVAHSRARCTWQTARMCRAVVCLCGRYEFSHIPSNPLDSGCPGVCHAGTRVCCLASCSLPLFCGLVPYFLVVIS